MVCWGLSRLRTKAYNHFKMVEKYFQAQKVESGCVLSAGPGLCITGQMNLNYFTTKRATVCWVLWPNDR